MEDRQKIVLFLVFKFAFGKQLTVELPLCPTSLQFLPQSLPMHCRLPRNVNFASYPGGGSDRGKTQPTIPPFLAPFYQSPPPPKLPFPMPPGFPGYPGMPMPGPPVGPVPMPMPAPIGPIPVNGPAHKLPVIVMPYYAPDKSYQRPAPRPPQRPPSSDDTNADSSTSSDDSDCSGDSDTSSDTEAQSDHGRKRGRKRGRGRGHDSDMGWWKSKKGFRRNARRRSMHSMHKHRGHHIKEIWPREIVTPLLQYVNDNGYVIFEKKISKGEAKEWLGGENLTNRDDRTDYEDYEEKDLAENKVEAEKDKSKVLQPPFPSQVLEEKHLEPVVLQKSRKHYKYDKEPNPSFSDSDKPKTNAKDFATVLK